MKALDDILSGGGDAVPEQTTEEQATQAEAAQATESQTEEPEQSQSGQQKMVPHEALHAEKQKVKRYTEQVAEFDKTVSGLRDQNTQLSRQVAELLQRMPKQEQPPVPDWFENPEARTDHQIRQRIDPQLDQVGQALLAMAKDNAILRFTEEKVDAAEKAFIDALQSQKLDQADYQKVVGSQNRYTAAVQWHQRQMAQAEIGDDPVAFRSKLEAEILEKHGLTKDGQPVPQSAARPAVMPSNLAGARNVGTRAGPSWSGPSAIKDILGR